MPLNENINLAEAKLWGKHLPDKAILAKQDTYNHQATPKSLAEKSLHMRSADGHVILVFYCQGSVFKIAAAHASQTSALICAQVLPRVVREKSKATIYQGMAMDVTTNDMVSPYTRDRVLDFWITRSLKIDHFRIVTHAFLPSTDHRLMDVSITTSFIDALLDVSEAAYALEDEALKDAALSLLRNRVNRHIEANDLFSALERAYGLTRISEEHSKTIQKIFFAGLLMKSHCLGRIWSKETSTMEHGNIAHDWYLARLWSELKTEKLI